MRPERLQIELLEQMPVKPEFREAVAAAIEALRLLAPRTRLYERAVARMQKLRTEQTAQIRTLRAQQRDRVQSLERKLRTSLADAAEQRACLIRLQRKLDTSEAVVAAKTQEVAELATEVRRLRRELKPETWLPTTKNPIRKKLMAMHMRWSQHFFDLRRCVFREDPPERFFEISQKVAEAARVLFDQAILLADALSEAAEQMPSNSQRRPSAP